MGYLEIKTQTKVVFLLTSVFFYAGNVLQVHAIKQVPCCRLFSNPAAQKQLA